MSKLLMRPTALQQSHLAHHARFTWYLCPWSPRVKFLVIQPMLCTGEGLTLGAYPSVLLHNTNSNKSGHIYLNLWPRSYFSKLVQLDTPSVKKNIDLPRSERCKGESIFLGHRVGRSLISLCRPIDVKCIQLLHIKSTISRAGSGKKRWYVPLPLLLHCLKLRRPF